jgi:hypothetical protein
MPITLDKVPIDKNFRALLIGPTGRGKTIAAASWPGKTLVIDFDHRHKPIIDWFPDRLGEISVEVIYPSNYWDVFKSLVDSLESGKLKFDNVVVDGITTLSNTTVVMQMIAKGQGPEKGKITKGGVAVPSWDEFNGEAMLITQLLETLKSIRCNLFVTAHPVSKTRIEGTKSIKETSIISFGTKLGPMIPAYFDEVYAFDYEFDINAGKPVKRLVFTSPTSDYPDVKTALKGLPPKLDITGKNLYDVMKEYL